MFCTNCGELMEPQDMFCVNCGTKRQEYEIKKPVVEATTAAGSAAFAKNPPILKTPRPEAAPAQITPEAPQNVPVIPQNAVMTTNWKNSYFVGTVLGLIGVNLLTCLVSAITLGFGAPAMTCYRLRWIYSHTCVGGYRLKFTGRGGQLFGKYLVWVLLTLITIGIYGFWVPIKYKKWEISHVEIDSVVSSIG